ncbi:MAG: ABC transporter substrate-binding protein [Roseiflexus sp.]
MSSVTHPLTTADALDTLARRAPASNDLHELAAWIQANGHRQLSAIERIELAEQLITRRRFLIGVGALGLGVITGCGAEEQASAPTATVAATRAVTDALGRTVTIPQRPARVVALHDLDNAYAIASLGFAPIGMGSITLGDRFERLRSLGPIPATLDPAIEVGLLSDPNLETIAGLRPDLILGTTLSHEKIIDQLTKIAPTVLIDNTGGDEVLSNQRFQADLVGVLDRFNTRVAEYEAAMADLRQRYVELFSSLEYTRIDSFGAGPEDNYLLLSTLTPSYRVLDDLGAQRSKTNVGPQGELFPVISPERLPDYDADVFFVGVPAGEQLAPQLRSLLAATFAGQRNQIFTVDYGAWGFRNVEALFVVLRDIETILQDRQLDTSGAFR